MEDQKEYTEIKFKYIYKTEEDEDIRVVGNIEKLGNWDCELAFRLINSEEDKDIWTSKTNIKIPINFDLEYKYILYKDGIFEKWEKLPHNKNRAIKIPDSGQYILYDAEEDPNTFIEKNKEDSLKSESKKAKNKSSKSTILNKKNLSNIINNTEGNSSKKIKKKGIKKSKTDDFQNEEILNKKSPKKKTKTKKKENKEKEKNKDIINGNKKIENQENNSNNLNSLPTEETDEYADLNYDSNEEDSNLENNLQQKNPKIDTKNYENEIDENDDIIICSMYLPLKPVKNENGEYDFSLTDEPIYRTLYKIIEGKKNIKWFGSLRNENDDFDENDREKITKLLQEKNLYLFEVDKEIYKKVLVLTQEILEPLFHYAQVKSPIMEDFKKFYEHWKAYQDYNDCVCKTISKYLTKKTLIHLNDIEFFLVPSFLFSVNKHKTEIIQNLCIGFFIHSPFPSFDVFKRIPIRDEVIQSLLKCRVIGFHTFDYSRNFLKSSKRLLSINYVSTKNGDLAINYLDYTALIRVKNVSPEIDLLKKDINSDEFKNCYNEIMKKHGHKKQIFVSLDHSSFLLSIKNKLEGYRKFLSELGEKSSKNVFILYIRYSSQNKKLLLQDKNHIEMVNTIDNLVSEIKNEFGDDVIDLQKGNVTYAQRLALFASANCFVRTSKQESYSLGLYEFLIVKKLLNQTGNIAYMISELSGVNASLGATIQINPFDYNSLRKGFLNASQNLSEENEQYTQAVNKDFIHAMKSSFKNWFYNFLKDVKNTKLNDENTFYFGVDEGQNFKLLKINKNFSKCNIKQISSEYAKSFRRLLLFDYEGTLPSQDSNQNNEFVSKGNCPTKEILSLLSELTSDKRNIVFIVAGKGPKRVLEWFGEVENLGLAAEHGFMYTIIKKKNHNWKKIIKNYNTEWIANCCNIISPYLERCEGSFLDIKESSVVWQYTDCDQELGKSFASLMSTELSNIVKKYNLKIVNGKGILEIIAMGINKGYFVSYILKEIVKKGRAPDFILCVGDDTSDEKMFHYLNIRKNEIKKYSKNAKLFSITVGRKPSKAKFYVEKAKNVQELISEFVKKSNKLSTCISTMDIRGLGLNSKFNMTEVEEENEDGFRDAI